MDGSIYISHHGVLIDHDHQASTPMLQSLVVGCKSHNKDVKVKSWTKIGGLLANAQRTNTGETIIDKLVDNGIISCLLEVVMNAKCDTDNIVEQALFCLTNITMSTNSSHIDHIVESQDRINALVDLTLSNNVEIADNAIWSLCNIVGTSIKHRNIVLQNAKILDNLIHVVSSCFNQLIGHDDTSNNDDDKSKCHKSDNIEQLITLPQRVAWMFRNFVHGGMNQIDIDRIETIIDGIGVLIHIPEKEILDEAVWAINLIAQSVNTKIDAQRHKRMVARMIKNDILTGLMLCVEYLWYQPQHGQTNLKINKIALDAIHKLYSKSWIMQSEHGFDILQFFSSLLDIKLRINDHNQELCQQMLKIFKQIISELETVDMRINFIQRIVENNIVSKIIKLLNKGLFKIDNNGEIYATYTIDSNHGKKNGELITLSKNKLLLLINGIFRQYLNLNRRKSIRPNDISAIIFCYFENDDDRYRNIRKYAANAVIDIIKDTSIIPVDIINKDLITSLCDLLNCQMTNRLDGNLLLVVMQTLSNLLTCQTVSVNYLGLIKQAGGLKLLQMIETSSDFLIDTQDGDITRSDVNNFAKDVIQQMCRIELKANVRRLMKICDLRIATPRIIRKRFVCFDT